MARSSQGVFSGSGFAVGIGKTVGWGEDAVVDVSAGSAVRVEDVQAAMSRLRLRSEAKSFFKAGSSLRSLKLVVRLDLESGHPY